MGNPKGFLNVKRESCKYRPVSERAKDYSHVYVERSDELSREQASRCMDCGTPFCNWGCPLGNYIPEWNDLVYADQFDRAADLLNATNNLPEITGRVCPAPCEYACVLGINDDPVTIRENELAIIENAFKNGLIEPNPPKKRTGKKVAIIGSGPAGLSCAAELNRKGHQVTVYERDEKIGGLMRYGIPEFKLEKHIIDRRIKIWEKEGIKFIAGKNIDKLPKGFDAVCLTGGSRVPRDLKIPGRELEGVHFAMEYLTKLISAKNKKVVVIGGGDTGADCVGTANRQGAKCVIQIEVLPKPPEQRPENQPWPKYPMLLKTTSSHDEGCERHWSISTKQFIGKNGSLNKLLCFNEETKKEFEIEADLTILAIGFLHPEHNGLLDNIGLEYDQRGNVKTDTSYMTSKKGVFCAGDMRRGQSLIVWAIYEGRQAAVAIDKYLM